MKQKNLILMVVAVGCGLVAAVLTSQMSAKPKVETVHVIVAARDLPVGTLFTKEDLPKMVKTKQLPKDAVPPEYVQTHEDLLEKRLSRPIRADESFNPKDLNKGSIVTLPPGMDMMTVAMGMSEAVAGFVTPGSKVDILATRNSGNKKVAFPLLVDMLVVAVDQTTGLPEKGGTFAALNTVSFAVDRDQALLLQLARSSGCTLALVLRHQGNTNEKDENWNAEDVLSFLQNPDKPFDTIIGRNPRKKEKAPEVVAPPKVETVQLPVATEDIAAGTALTKDVIAKFKKTEVSGKAPANAVLDLDLVEGKVLQHSIAANQWLPPGLRRQLPARKGSAEVFGGAEERAG